jgi:hypothetical protein
LAELPAISVPLLKLMIAAKNRGFLTDGASLKWSIASLAVKPDHGILGSVVLALSTRAGGEAIVALPYIRTLSLNMKNTYFLICASQSIVTSKQVKITLLALRAA